MPVNVTTPDETAALAARITLAEKSIISTDWGTPGPSQRAGRYLEMGLLISLLDRWSRPGGSGK